MNKYNIIEVKFSGIVKEVRAYANTIEEAKTAIKELISTENIDLSTIEIEDTETGNSYKVNAKLGGF